MMINVGSAVAYLDLDTSKYSAGLRKAEQQIKGFGDKTQSASSKFKSLGSGMTSVGSALSLGVTMPLVGVGAAALNTAANFEQGMSKVQALSGATGDDLAMLEEKAREMGASTKFSATEASEGLEYLALAGWDAEQMAEGLEPALLLAGAAGMELGQTADIVTDTMSMFSMEAEEATKMTDMLAYAQANSNTDVAMLGEAMKYAGASANAMGYDLADTTAYLGKFADQGLKGSTAGTTFNAMLRDMKKSSEDGAIAIGETSVAIVDAQGNYRDMNGILADVEVATKDMTQAERDMALSSIFGTEALKGVNIALETGSDELKKFEDSIRGSDGASKDMYDTMQDNLKGAVDELKSSLSEAGISIGDTLVPAVKDLSSWIKDSVDKFNSLDDSTKENIVKFGLFVAAAGPVLTVLGKISSGIGTVISVSKGIGGVTSAIGGVTTASTTASGAVGVGGLATSLGTAVTAAAPFIAGVAAIGGVAYATYKHFSEELTPEVDLFADKVEGSTQKVVDANGRIHYSYDETVTKISDATEQAVGSYMKLDDEATSAIYDLYVNSTTISGDIKEEIVADFQTMGNQVNEALEEDKEEALTTLESLYAESEGRLDESQATLLAKTDEFYTSKQETVNEGQQEIASILELAREENRSITEEEYEQIIEIKNRQREQAVQALSEQEIEAGVILERIKSYDERMTAEQASNHIQTLNNQRDQAIAAAEAEYEGRVAEIIRLRDEAGTISSEQATELIEEARRQRDGTIEKAEETRDGAVRKMREQNSDLESMVNTSTGKILTKWDQLKSWWSRWKPETKTFNSIMKSASEYAQNPGKTYDKTNYSQTPYSRWTGDDNFPGGLSYLAEEGQELLVYPDGRVDLTGHSTELRNLPRGTQIFNNQDTEAILSGGTGRKIRGFASGNTSLTNMLPDTGVLKDISVLLKDIVSGMRMQAPELGSVDNPKIENTINVYNPVIREEADLDRLATKITTKIDRDRRTRERAGGRVVYGN